MNESRAARMNESRVTNCIYEWVTYDSRWVRHELHTWMSHALHVWMSVYIDVCLVSCEWFICRVRDWFMCNELYKWITHTHVYIDVCFDSCQWFICRVRDSFMCNELHKWITHTHVYVHVYFDSCVLAAAIQFVSYEWVTNSTYE